MVESRKVQADLSDIIQTVRLMNASRAELAKLTAADQASRLKLWVESLAQRTLSSESKRQHMEDYLDLAVRQIESSSWPGELFCSLPNRGPALLLLTEQLFELNFVRRVLPLIVAGCPVVLKAPRRAERVAQELTQWVRDSLEQAELSPDLIQVLYGDPSREDLGATLIEHPAFHQVYWIGRTEGALKLRARLALLDSENSDRPPKYFHFSGSGRNPLVLFDGLSESELQERLTQLAHAICSVEKLGAYRPTRLFIHDRIYKDAITFLQAQMKHHNGPEPHQRESFRTQIESAVKEGAHRVGEPDDLRPTLIRDLTNCSLLQNQEPVGPWANSMSFKYIHDVTKAVGPSPLGLMTYLIHSDQDKAQRFSYRFESARVHFDMVPQLGKILFSDARSVKGSGQGEDGFLSIAFGAKSNGPGVSDILRLLR